jgi:hypothetical protein
MFLAQQFIIQRAVKIIARIPAGVPWMFTATNEDGEARPDGAPCTQASLDIDATPDTLDAVLAVCTGPWEKIEQGDDAADMYWRTEGGVLEVVVTVNE